MKPQPLIQHCPKCLSNHVYRSRRRNPMDTLLDALGAEISRCHNCRFRYARFKVFTVPLNRRKRLTGKVASSAVTASGFLLCLVLVLWMIRRFTELSG